MAGKFEVTVPDIGDYKNVPVIEILVKEGERVEKDAALLTLESEKATMEVPAPQAGIVRGIRVKVGDKLNVGDTILALESESAAPSVPPGFPSVTSAGDNRSFSMTPAAAEATAKPETPKPTPPNVKPPEGPVAAVISAPAHATASSLAVTMPDIGDYKSVPVIEVLIKDGDVVEKDAPLIVLESEKSTMEVPAPLAGTVRGLKIKPGSKLSQGDVICSLEVAGSAHAETPAVQESPLPLGEAAQRAGEGARPASALTPTLSQGERGEERAPPAPPWVGQAGAAIPHASPSIRKFARELGVDLRNVHGSGLKGRITQDDVQSFVKTNLAGAPAAVAGGAGIPPIPAVDFSQWGEVETKPLARIRKISAQYLHRAWLNIPHVTQHDQADITELEVFRKSQSEESGVKLTLLPFIMKAVSVGLKQFPEFNSSLAPDGENLILKKYCHLGFAADTPNGLVVPVVKDVWSKGIVQLAQDCGELAKKARDGKLKPDEMKGGCFTISSLGGLGVTGGFTPIVNAPEVAILGVSRATTQPVWNGKEFTPRLMLPLSLSYDHRVIDGAGAARFTVQLCKLIADPRRLIL